MSWGGAAESYASMYTNNVLHLPENRPAYRLYTIKLHTVQDTYDHYQALYSFVHVHVAT